MRNAIANAFLPLFYIFAIVCIVYSGYYFYNKELEQQQMILDIEKRLTLQETGSVVQLPIKNNIDKEKLNYTVANEDVAIIHDDGTVVAVGEGTTSVTIRTDDDEKQQTILISVGQEAIEETDDEEYVDGIIEEIKQEEEQENKTEEVEIASLEVNKSEINLGYNDTFTPSITILPNNASNKKIIWTSSNPGLVTVDSNGLIKAISNENGLCVITGTTENKLHSVAIKVRTTSKTIEATSITLNKSNITLKANESITVQATVLPSNVTDPGVEYSSSNPNLVTVDQNGKITAVANEDGQAIITASTNGGKLQTTATINIQKVVTTVPVSNITLNKKSIQLKYGEKSYLAATILPENATNKKIVYTSSNPSLIRVDQFGKVTVLKNETGTAIITASTPDGKHKATATVDTVINPIKVSSINLNQNKVSLSVNQNFQFIATVNPLNATNKKVVWTSSNPNLVSVNQSGLATVKQNKAGTVTITVTSEDTTISNSAQVNIVKTSIPVSSLELNKTNYTLKYGEKDTINVLVLPENASNKEVTYRSSNPKLVTVSSKGIIKAIDNQDGNVTVTVTTKDGAFKKNINVTVKKQKIDVTKIKIKEKSINLSYGSSKEIIATVYPKTATDKSITWTSSDQSIAKVTQKGKIIANANKVGIATITAKKGNVLDSLTVRVYPSGKAISYKTTYSTYKSDMLINNRQYNVMQSFAIDGDQIYISQKEPENQKSGVGACLSVTTGEKIVKSSAFLKGFDHVANISIETTNGKKYLWTDCGKDRICRVSLNAITFSQQAYLQDPSKKVYKEDGLDLVAVDSSNRTLVTMTGSKRYHKFTTYNLDDFIANGTGAKKTFEFKIDNGNDHYSKQGFVVSGNYIYSYEGNTSDSQYPKVYISTYSLQGDAITRGRKRINYPNSTYMWEPEGIKIHNNRILIGFGAQDKKTLKKTAYIYRLNQ